VFNKHVLVSFDNYKNESFALVCEWLLFVVAVCGGSCLRIKLLLFMISDI
jgi:hypothetical protein